jgi:hypothetical protein
MTRRISALASLVLIVLVWVSISSADIPKTINYQGILTDTSTGEPLTGSVSMTFRLYETSSGGTEVWSETQSATADENGVVSAILGSTTPIGIDFDNPVWLEVEVGGEVLSPRREVASVPFAFHAMNADYLGGVAFGAYWTNSNDGPGSGLDADLLDGLEASAFAGTIHNHDDRYYTDQELNTSDGNDPNIGSNRVHWNNLTGVPAGFADGTDEEGGAGDGHSLDAVDGNPVDAVYVDPTGDVGIGTTTPDRSLHVYNGSAGVVSGMSTAEVVIEDDAGVRVNLLTPNDEAAGISFGDPQDNEVGWIHYDHLNEVLFFGVDNADRAAIDQHGRLGVGTTAPSTGIDLYDNANEQVIIRIRNTNTGSNSGERLSFDNENGSLAYIATYDDGYPSVPSSMVMANNRPSGNLRFRTGNADRIYVANNGRVGIGTTDPETGLALSAGGGYYEPAIAIENTDANMEWRILVHDDESLNLMKITGLTFAAACFHSNGDCGINTINTSGRFHIYEDRDDNSPADPNEALYVEHASENVSRVANIVRTEDAAGANDLLQIVTGSGSAADCQFIECQIENEVKFKVQGNGDVYTDGDFYNTGADFAEMIEVGSGVAGVEPGDVMVIDTENPRSVLRASQARSTLVAGIYSSDPGFICSERGWDITDLPLDSGSQPPALELMASEYSEIPLAVVGIVPCKVSAENGPISPGDLLVTSSTPGHAMRDDGPGVGTVLGKALGSLQSGTGVVKVLVTLQ